MLKLLFVYVLPPHYTAEVMLGWSVILTTLFLGRLTRTQCTDEPGYEKTGFLHMRKQRRRSASW